jgi:predicted MFS family arabinose efflux permease
MLAFSDHIRTVLWFATVPAFIAVIIILFGVREPESASARGASFRSPLHWRSMREFSGRYWYVVAIGATFTLARFSEAFLVLRAQQTGLDIAWIPAVMVVMSLAYSASAYPAGVLSDRWDRRALLACGLALLIAADVLLGAGSSMLTLFAGVALWGLHMGFTQGILAAMVAESAPPSLRGTAFGVFNLASGVCMVLASAIAGWIWDRHGAPATFYTGAALALIPLVMCFAPRRADSASRKA